MSLPSVADAFHNSIGGLFPGVSNVGPPISLIIIGIVLILIVIFSPGGLAPLFQKLYKYLNAKPSAKEAKKK